MKGQPVITKVLALLMAMLVTVGVPVRGEAAQGDLDPGFGVGGKVTTPFGAFAGAAAVAVQNDGKIVTAGFADTGLPDMDPRLGLVRYQPDGSLDPAFGVGGRVTVNFLPDYPARIGLAIQEDGKILIAGKVGSPSDFAIARYLPSGAPDLGFGTNGDGTVTTDFGQQDEATSIVVQSDGKIVVAGRTFVGFGQADFALARYDATGALDGTFGIGGKVTTDLLGGDDGANGLAIQADGKIVAIGTAVDAAFARYFAVVRYNADGTLDLTSFGGGTGKVTTPFFDFTEANAVAIQPTDGKIVVVGTTFTVVGVPTPYYDFAIARYNTDGSLDGGFGTGGKVLTDFAPGFDRATGVTIQADGKIVVVGSRADASDDSLVEIFIDVAIARYDSTGALDPAFGTGGKVVINFGQVVDTGSIDEAGGVAIQADCKIVVAGYSWDVATGGSVFALSRHEGPACVTEPPVAQRCPKTHGFWKNKADWPVDSLMLGTVSYTKAQLLALLGMSGSTDASLTLSRQLIAAKLNVANGSDPTPVASTIPHADTLLGGFNGALPYKVKASSPIGQSMVTDANLLDQYNRGLLTPTCTP